MLWCVCVCVSQPSEVNYPRPVNVPVPANALWSSVMSGTRRPGEACYIYVISVAVCYNKLLRSLAYSLCCLSKLFETKFFHFL